jgi:hypothetical protein
MYVPAVRCTVGGTSSAVHTSTAARVPLDGSHRPARLRWRCTKRRVLLAHSLTLAVDLCIIVPGSVGEVPALVCMHYQCTRQLMYTKHRRQFRQKNRILQTKRKKIDTAHSCCAMAIFPFLFLFLLWLQTTSATGSPPRK